MKDLSKFEELANEFKKKLEETNQKVIEKSTTVEQNVLTTNYLSALEKIKKINLKYNELLLLQTEIGDTFLQVMCYLLYYEKIKNQISEYKNLMDLMNFLFAKDSMLNQLLAQLEKYLFIYYDTASSVDEKANARVMIIKILNQLKDLLKSLFSKLNMLDEEATINEDPETHEIKITSKAYRNISVLDTDTGDILLPGESVPQNKILLNGNDFQAYTGVLNRSGYIAQKSFIYVQRPIVSGSFTNNIFVTAPGAGLMNVEYINDPKNIIFNIFNVYDYTNTYLIENEEEEEKKDDDENEGPKGFMKKTRAIRFGHILSGKNIDDVPSQSIIIRFDFWNQIKGSLYKRNRYHIDKLTVSAKFNGQDHVSGDLINTKYPLIGETTKFADAIEISQYVHNVDTNQSFIMRGTLNYDEDLTEDKRTENNAFNVTLYKDTHDENGQPITDKKHYLKGEDYFKYFKPEGSYYTGTLKLLDENGKELNSDDSENMSKRLSSKDVICKIEPIDDGKKLNIFCKINDENTSNLTCINEDQDTDIAILPTFLSNFQYHSLPIINDLILDDPSKQLMMDLLNLAYLNIDDEKFQQKYSDLLNSFLKAKEEILGLILSKINQIEEMATAITTISGLMPQFDETFQKEFIDSLIQSFGKITTDIMPYTKGANSNIEDLYNGNLYSTINNDIDNVGVEFNNLLIDIRTADEELNELQKKLITFNNLANFNTPSLVGAINAIYNILTLNSQSIKTLEVGGYNFISLPMITYNKWLYYFSFLPNGQKLSDCFYFSDFMKVIMYASSQILPYLNQSSEQYTNIVKYLQLLFTRMIFENANNEYYEEFIKTDKIKIIRDYKDVCHDYRLNLSNINSDYINPYAYTLFPTLKLFDTFDLSNINYDTGIHMGKTLIYTAILKDKTSILDQNLFLLLRFLFNGQRLNLREIILIINLLEVYKELNEDEISKKYLKYYNQFNIDECLTKYKKIFEKLINYYDLVNHQNKNVLTLFSQNPSNEQYNYIVSIYHIEPTMENPNIVAESTETVITTTFNLYDLLTNNIRPVERTYFNGILKNDKPLN